MLSENIKEELIFMDLDVQTREEVFHILGGKLTELNYTKESFVPALKEREKVFPTGLDVNGVGVAIPHTDQTHVNATALALAVLKNPVEFHQMASNIEDHQMVPVRFIIMLAVSGANYMDFLQNAILLIQDQEVLKRIVNAKTKEEIMHIVKEKEN